MTLIELLLSLFLSTLLGLVLIQHLFLVNRMYQYIQAVLHEVIELQWAFDVMRIHIHHAGFTPCLGLNRLTSIDTRDVPEPLQAIALEQGVLPQLVIRKMDETQFGLAKRLAPDRLYLKKKRLKLKSKQPIIISDCKHAEIHEIDKARRTKSGYMLRLKKPLVFDYSSEVYAGAWISEAFFFRKSKGLLMKQQRVDYIAAAEDVRFDLEKHADYANVMLTLVSNLHRRYCLEVRTRML